MNARKRLAKAIDARERSLALARQIRPDLVRFLSMVQTNINTPLNGNGVRIVRSVVSLVLLELTIEDLERELANHAEIAKLESDAKPEDEPASEAAPVDPS